MEITQIRKRDGSVVDFKVAKIEAAVLKAFGETGEGSAAEAAKVATLVNEKILAMCVAAMSAEPGDHHYGKCVDGYPTVEEIQDLVEAAVMELGFFETAKAYIIYRADRKRLRQRDLFQKRTNLKPYEYPELIEYVTAIRHSYWLHTEFNFTRDIDDFKTRVADHERDAIKKTMLAIAQIEVAVKSFWGNIYGRIPKPEIGAVGFTFAESEVRHMDAYAHLLDILGLNDEFKKLTDIPVIKKRVEYLEKVITFSKTGEMREYSQAVLLFSLFIEHVSLFSQFLIMMSFNKYKNLFKGISNAVEATSKEEQIHGMFGIDLINIIRVEHPEWFDESHRETVRMMCVEAYQAESAIIDWIFETGELDFLPKDQVKEFVKHRLNNSLRSIGMSAVFSVDEALLDKTEWFNDEVIATKHVDFFDKRSINYSKRQSSVTSDDLF
ncbi:ribonucleotide reductase [Candidatus Kaiserbacteria bacterium RIFOXYB1_FULL_46_14]|uniref:ribonucleoside-diphosphate reductase n=1 Tax=Candidatus Kaiserbacteria bacterium RIFOXYB1_FULL_46_14 TaxID=1798531 RepID=A0A1F6FJ66_9BACT|nr:MAG: ribonucleotide reductase [Candidatus Kaiserbacteria bacterium RIFOXYB1_FULL_46_14]